jgi:nucleotide-binding universal stress UspA family protein
VNEQKNTAMEIQPKHILVPTDFSDSSRAALAWATGLCGGCSGSLHLLHVLETLSVADPLDVPFRSRRQVESAVETGAREELQRLLLPEDLERLRVKIVIEWGTPLLEIIRYAAAHQIGLIAMGAHGHRTLSHMWLGSVAAHVVRSAPCAVLVVRALPVLTARERPRAGYPH